MQAPFGNTSSNSSNNTNSNTNNKNSKTQRQKKFAAFNIKQQKIEFF
jgi:hypothetical protein